MAEYLLIGNTSENDKASLSADVFKNIVQIAVARNEEMSPAKKENEFVSCKFSEGNVILNLAVKLRLGCNVAGVCKTVQTKIYDDILGMTGLRCKNIHVDILGFTAAEK